MRFTSTFVVSLFTLAIAGGCKNKHKDGLRRHHNKLKDVSQHSLSPAEMAALHNVRTKERPSGYRRTKTMITPGPSDGVRTKASASSHSSTDLVPPTTTTKPVNVPTTPAQKPTPPAATTTPVTTPVVTPTTTSTTTKAPPAQTSQPSSSGQLSTLAAQALKDHNDFRALHGAKALIWDDTVAASAQAYSDGCKFVHSGGPYGENLAAQTGSNWDVDSLIKMWEDEAKDYNPSNPNYSHFTQMVWKSSTTLGCGFTLCAPGKIFDASYGQSQYLVCQYDPAGNVLGQFPQNVQP